MYNYHANDPTTLTDSSLINFLKAKAAFKNEDKDRRDEEAKVCHLILSSLWKNLLHTATLLWT
jgi:hypothetical protein